MKKYAPMEITDFAKKEAENYPYLTGDLPAAQAPDFRRIVKTDAAFARENRIKMRTDGTDGFSINKSEVDMRYVEQLVDSEQLTSLAYIIKSMKLHDFDGKKTLQEAIRLCRICRRRISPRQPCHAPPPGIIRRDQSVQRFDSNIN